MTGCYDVERVPQVDVVSPHPELFDLAHHVYAWDTETGWRPVGRYPCVGHDSQRMAQARALQYHRAVVITGHMVGSVTYNVEG